MQVPPLSEGDGRVGDFFLCGRSLAAPTGAAELLAGA